MAVSETENQKHARLARELLDSADHHLMAGSPLKASQQLGEAADHAITAICQRRGWPHGEYAHYIKAADTLADELRDQGISWACDIAKSCGDNATYDWMKCRDLDRHRVNIRSMVETILGM